MGHSGLFEGDSCEIHLSMFAIVTVDSPKTGVIGCHFLLNGLILLRMGHSGLFEGDSCEIHLSIFAIVTVDSPKTGVIGSITLPGKWAVYYSFGELGNRKTLRRVFYEVSIIIVSLSFLPFLTIKGSNLSINSSLIACCRIVCATSLTFC